MRILIIERDAILRELLIRMVEDRFGGQADSVASGTDGIEYAGLFQFDVVLVDYQHNQMAPEKLVAMLRTANADASILVLDTQHDPLIKASALNAGADDYLDKPFSLEELHSRVIAVMRRRMGLAEPFIFAGPLTIDLILRKASVGQMHLSLSPKQFAVLIFLAMRRGAVVSSDEIFRRVWGDLSKATDKNVEQQIYQLRRVLTQAGINGRALIRNSHGAGWAFDAEALT
jgi:DNA-binding response OmpR family regulator